MSNLYLVRHGQSLWNLENRFTGKVNIPLSNYGREQATKLSPFFAKINLDMVFVSSLIRAQETALIALAQYSRTCQLVKTEDDILSNNLPLIIDARINERDYGELQGMNKQEIARKFGNEQVKNWRRSYAERPKNGESLADTCQRVDSFLQDVLKPQLKMQKNIAIFAHGNSIRALHKIILELSDIDIVEFEVQTGDILHYIYSGGKFEFQS